MSALGAQGKGVGSRKGIKNPTRRPRSRNNNQPLVYRSTINPGKKYVKQDNRTQDCIYQLGADGVVDIVACLERRNQVAGRQQIEQSNLSLAFLITERRGSLNSQGTGSCRETATRGPEADTAINHTA